MAFSILYAIAVFYLCIKLTQQASFLQRPQCDPGLIYINSGGLDGCYKLVELGDKCQHNKQCLVHKSFCGSADLAKHECQCNYGHAPSLDGSTCVEYQKCSMLGFNSAMDPSTDCAQNQFCRNGACHCRPGLQFNHVGDCVSIGDEHSNAIKDLYTRNKVHEDKLNKQQNQLERHYYLTYTNLGGLILAFVGVIVALFLINKRYRSKLAQIKAQLQRQPSPTGEEKIELEPLNQGNVA